MQHLVGGVPNAIGELAVFSRRTLTDVDEAGQVAKDGSKRQFVTLKKAANDVRNRSVTAMSYHRHVVPGRRR